MAETSSIVRPSMTRPRTSGAMTLMVPLTAVKPAFARARSSRGMAELGSRPAFCAV
jgi:hypothetical protein